MGKHDLVIFQCAESPGFLEQLADQIKQAKDNQAYLLLDYPVVYLHVWQDKSDAQNGTYHIYVGEAENAVRRQGELRVLMTRETKGLFIYACDRELREALRRAAEH